MKHLIISIVLSVGLLFCFLLLVDAYEDKVSLEKELNVNSKFAADTPVYYKKFMIKKHKRFH